MSSKRKISLKAFAGIVVLIAVLYGVFKFYSGFYFSQTNDPVTLRFHYINYACGDCQPQWKADSVLRGSRINYLDKDMWVYYNGKELDDQLGKEVWTCIGCHHFYLTGQVQTTMSGKYKFIAEQYSFNTDETCCNN